MSPRITLTNCGSSSSRNFRNHFPTRVIRSVLSQTHSDLRTSARCMVRNLNNLKRFADMPTRSWTKNTGPRESSLINRAIRPIRGASVTSPTTAAMRLMRRPAAKSRGDFLKSLEKIKLLGVSDSIASLPVNRSYAVTPSSTILPFIRASRSWWTGSRARRSANATMTRSGCSSWMILSRRSRGPSNGYARGDPLDSGAASTTPTMEYRR